MAGPQARFGSRVRAIRKSRRWTQEELAARSGRHPTYIGGIERGERNITIQVIADIARALGVRITELFETGPVPK